MIDCTKDCFNVLGGDLAVAIDKSIFLEFSKSADSLGFQSLYKLCQKQFINFS